MWVGVAPVGPVVTSEVTGMGGKYQRAAWLERSMWQHFPFISLKSQQPQRVPCAHNAVDMFLAGF